MNIPTSSVSKRWTDHAAPITHLDICPNEEYLLTASEDQALNIVKMVDESIDTSFYVDFPIRVAKFINSETVALAGNTSLELFNFQMEISQFKMDFNYPVISMDVSSNTILIGCKKKRIYVFDYQ